MQLSFKIISAPGPSDSLIHDFIEANDTDFYPPIAARRDLWEFVQIVYDHKGKFVVCYYENNIVGLTSVFLDHPSFITYYHYIAIDKAFRHKGIANVLYDYVHQICRDYGVQRAIVKTWSTNQVSQAMFRRHGFFHIDTLEDDRSKGIHTYFFAKSFVEEWFSNPVKRLGIVAGADTYALGNFVKTISSIPKTISGSQPMLPFMVISNSYGRMSESNDEPGEPIQQAPVNDLFAALEANQVSHLLLLEPYKYPYLNYPTATAQIELVDLAGITRRLVNARNRKCMLVADNSDQSRDYFDIDGIILPAGEAAARIAEIVNEIKNGMVSPAYYKEETAAIVSSAGCNGILLGSAELHTMFGFDKVFHGIEIFDPWVELAIIIQNNRMKIHDQAVAAIYDNHPLTT